MIVFALVGLAVLALLCRLRRPVKTRDDFAQWARQREAHEKLLQAQDRLVRATKKLAELRARKQRVL